MQTRIEIIEGVIVFILFLLLFSFYYIPDKPEKNSKTQLSPLTMENLRNYNGLKNITNAEAENILQSFKMFSELTYRLFMEEKKNSINTQFTQYI